MILYLLHLFIRDEKPAGSSSDRFAFTVLLQKQFYGHLYLTFQMQ
jgi:hypothetical protein